MCNYQLSMNKNSDHKTSQMYLVPCSCPLKVFALGQNVRGQSEDILPTVSPVLVNILTPGKRSISHE